MRFFFAKGLELVERALDKAKSPVRFWWRDDDAGAVSPALERLLRLSHDHRAPVSLAVIPMRVEPLLIEIMSGHRDVDVLVHGYAHRNHAADGQPKCEFPHSRPLEEIRNELSGALSRLREAFPQNAIPVFVPPWNRLPPELAPILKECGYVGFSTASTLAPASVARADGLRQSDGHFSVVAWKSGPQLADVEPLEKRLAKQIRAGSKGPFCIVTHHRDHNEDVWKYCEQLWTLLGNHRNAEIVPAREIFC